MVFKDLQSRWMERQHLETKSWLKKKGSIGKTSLGSIQKNLSETIDAM